MEGVHVISVVVPAYNEAALLESSVRAIANGVRATGEPFEIHVVENGSTDGTPAIAAGLEREMPEVHVQTMRAADYGEALRTGLLAASGDVAVIFDVDYHDERFLKEALQVLDAGEDPGGPVIVVGSKRAPGARDERSGLRRLVTATFTGILHAVFGLTLSDTHGMKVLNLGVLREQVRACRFGADLFDTELILRTTRAGYAVAELPVTVVEMRPSRTPIVRRVPRTLVGLVRLRTTMGRPHR
jgi:glycosyltransferase involved in cell wall biosynthesis